MYPLLLNDCSDGVSATDSLCVGALTLVDLLDTAAKRTLYLGLVDIIFAYAYNYRTTEGEGSVSELLAISLKCSALVHQVESAWTICKLSSTLCWLEQFHGSVHEVLHYCVRRALCFPLYRHWELSLAVLQDTRNIFRLGMMDSQIQSCCPIGQCSIYCGL